MWCPKRHVAREDEEVQRLSAFVEHVLNSFDRAVVDDWSRTPLKAILLLRSIGSLDAHCVCVCGSIEFHGHRVSVL